jgi:hypothetical protein
METNEARVHLLQVPPADMLSLEQPNCVDSYPGFEEKLLLCLRLFKYHEEPGQAVVPHEKGFEYTATGTEGVVFHFSRCGMPALEHHG